MFGLDYFRFQPCCCSKTSRARLLTPISEYHTPAKLTPISAFITKGLSFSLLWCNQHPLKKFYFDLVPRTNLGIKFISGKISKTKSIH